MASITYDGRSFQIDGRRIWLVSASMHFQRVPPEGWGDRLRLLKRAGFNTVETPVFWNAVEPRQGQFDFTGPNDLRAFCELAAQHGLMVILRPGPFIGAGWDLGGLPAWLHEKEGLEVRTGNQPFLETLGKYFTNISKQVKDLQASSSSGGPIVLLQNESGWFCGHDTGATAYLGEINRYMREAGLNLPRINCNNLWAGVESDVDAWSGDDDMLATLRQLAVVKPDQPRLIADFGPKRRPAFGAEPEPALTPVELQRRLGEILAAGGQFNLAPAVSGTSFGFWAGQASHGEHRFHAPTQDLGGVIGEDGRPSEHYFHVRRIATFASAFSRVFASLEPDRHTVILDPAPSHQPERAIAGPVLTHLPGQQGSVSFVFAPAGKPKSGNVEILLPDGTSLPVDMGKQAVGWCLFDVQLNSHARLDYSTLNAFAHQDDTLVVFGPAGGRGRLCINGTPLEMPVPKGKTPHVEEHEGVIVVCVNEDAIDQTHLGPEGVYVGIDGFTEDGEPLPGSSRSAVLVKNDGETKNLSVKHPESRVAVGAKAKVELSPWGCAPATAYADGSSPRFATIPGPAELGALGSPYGYGWYRLTFKAGATSKVKLGVPMSGDRTQVILDGESAGVVGEGPGTDEHIACSISKGDRTITLLSDNMGRISAGSDLRDPKGVWGQLYDLIPFKPGKCTLEVAEPMDILEHRMPVFGVREGDTTHPMRPTWAFQHRRKSPLFMRIPPMPHAYLLLLNDEVMRVVDSHRAVRITLDDDTPLKRGNNVLQIALIHHGGPDADAELKDAHTTAASTVFLEGKTEVSGKATWAFAKWEAPTKGAFEEAARPSKQGIPTWWRTTFDLVRSPEAPPVFELGALSKGVLVLNGKTLGRYFAQTGTGDKVPPIGSVPLPLEWLQDEGNELLLFDEHGAAPTRAKISYSR